MMLFPSVISQYLAVSGTPWLEGIASWVSLYLVNTNLWWYWALYFVLVVAFTYFYAYVMFQQQNIPENLQKQGAFIPGYRPGEPTSKYLYDILKRVTLAGAVFLGLIAILPSLLQSQVLSGASLLIVVGVVLDTLRQLESQMVMRNYSGFLS
jgi:preprotein translocase subunit SecY